MPEPINPAFPSALPARQTVRLTYLDALRGTAIIFVVWLHASAYSHHEVTLPWAQNLLRLVDPGVAFFFLADGFLFARHLQRPQAFDSLDYLRKSAWRLLLPWLIFNVVYGLLRVGFEAAGFFPNRLLVGQPWSVIAMNLFNSTVAMQMYFLMAMFLIRALCPLTRHLAKGRRWVTLAVTILYIILLHVSGFKLGFDPVTSAVAGLQYYLLGLLFYQLDPWFRRFGWWIALACVAGYWGLLWVETLGLVPLSAVQKAAKLAGMTGNYALYLMLADYLALLVKLGQHTMEIYLLHAPVLVFAVASVVNRLVANPLASHVVVTVLAIALAILGGLLIKRLPGGRLVFGEATGKA